jgi:hypothetical protein
MAQFVQCRAKPVDRLEESSLGRHLHHVMGGGIERFPATDAEGYPAALDHAISAGNGQLGRNRRHGGNHVLGQVLALVEVEHGKALEKGHGARFAVFVPGLGGFLARGEAIGIADHRALLAAPDMAPGRFGLAIGQPALRGKALLDGRGPENQK